MPYMSDSEIEEVVRNFETCTTGKDDFHHAQHLVVAAYYLQSLTIEAATERLRGALFRFLEHHQVDTQKYNETLTVFWLKMVALELKNVPVGASLVEKCNSVIAVLSNAKLPLDFYSGDLLWSDEARNGFVEPDLRPWS